MDSLSFRQRQWQNPATRWKRLVRHLNITRNMKGMIMLTHAEARSMFGRCSNQSVGYKLANTTYIQSRGSSFAVRLHNTDIVVIRPDGTYKVNSGGFRTTTTKRRMNHVLPCVISQKTGLWSIGDSFFEDFMVIGHDGAIVSKSIPLSRVLKIKRRVDRYCNKFISLVLDMCVIEPITELRTYKKYRLPKHDNERHLDELWYNEIRRIVDYAKSSPKYVSTFYDRLMKWAYLSMLERGHSDIQWCWDYRRNACAQQDTDVVKGNLLAFMLRRKSNITQIILDDEEEDARYPSVSEAEDILSQQLVMVS